MTSPPPESTHPNRTRLTIARLGALVVVVALLVALVASSRSARAAKLRAERNAAAAAHTTAQLDEVAGRVATVLDLLRAHDPTRGDEVVSVSDLVAALDDDPATVPTASPPLVVTVRPGAPGPQGPAGAPGSPGAPAPSTSEGSRAPAPTPPRAPVPSPSPPARLCLPLVDLCLRGDTP